MKYIDKIEFSKVKGTGINLNTGLPIFSRKYEKDDEGNILSTKSVVNAVDIDWNGAQLTNANQEINSTGDLLFLVDSLAAGSTPSVEGLASKEYVDNKIAEIEIPSTEGLASEEYVDNKVDAIQIPSVDGLASEEYVNSKIAEIEIPNVDNFVTADEINTKFANLIGSAPETLDTLEELSYAIQNNVSVIESLETIASSKVDAEYVDNKIAEIEIPSVEGLASEEYVDNKVDAIEIPSIEGLASEEYVDNKVDAIEIPSVEGLASEEYVDNKVDAIQIPSVDGLASEEYVDEKIAYTENKIDSIEIPSVDGLASEEYVDEKIAEIEIPSIVGLVTKDELSETIHNLVGEAPETLDTIHELAYEIQNNESVIAVLDGALTNKAETEYVNEQIAYLEDKIDAIEIPSVDGLASEEYVDNKVDAIQIPSVDGLASEEYVDNKFDSIEIPSVEGLASEEYVDNKVDAIQIPSVDGFATETYVDNKVDSIVIPTKVSDLENDANYINEHQDLSGYVPVETFNELLADFNELKQYVDVYLKLTPEELAAKNQAIIASLNANNTSVELPAGEVDTINLPEATKTYKVTANLADDTEINLTTSRAATIINTADNTPNVTINAPEVEGVTSQAPNVSLQGNFDTLTLENISVTNTSGGLLAPTVPITVNNVVISENNTRTIRVNAAFNDGATVTNNSNSDVILQNMNSEDPTDVTIIAPNSTATLYGTWNTVNAEVGDNTLIINPAVRIDTLVVKRGNVLVKSAYVSDCIENVVNDPANYTEAPQNESGLWSVEALVNEVGDLTAFKKVASTPSIVRFTNDIQNTAAITYGITTSGHIVYDLNGHTYSTTGTNNSAVILARGSNLILDITGGGSIIGPENVNAYGIWLRAATSSYTPVLNIYDGTIIGATHTLYAESGIINVYGGTFKMYEFESTEKDVNGNFKFLLNCLDENYRNGTAQINVYGGTFWDFNPAEAYGEPGAPVSYVPEGYGVIMTTVVENDVEHKVYEVRPINE